MIHTLNVIIYVARCTVPCERSYNGHERATGGLYLSNDLIVGPIQSDYNF
jgi:hypothetical protein